MISFVNYPPGAISNLNFIDDLNKLPSSDAGIIYLLDNTAYFFTKNIDLLGNRFVCGRNTVILGSSSENVRLSSTGLDANTPLITSEWSLPIRGITISHGTALDLDASGNADQALDWFGVNFTDCATVGRIANYTNFIATDCALLNSSELSFDGNFGTVGFSSCLFNGQSGKSIISIPATAVIQRRFRAIYSSFITLVGETSIDIDPLATISDESYILDTCNFSGGGTYLSGVDDTSNTSLFVKCVGIVNTAVNGQLYMFNNATTTTVSLQDTFYKIAGTTTPSPDNQKYDHSNNRLTNAAKIERKFLVQATLSFNAGNNNVCTFGFYDSKLGGIRTPSLTRSTANSSGRAENVSISCIVQHGFGDYIEVHVSNSVATNVTVTDLNLIISEIT